MSLYHFIHQMRLTIMIDFVALSMVVCSFPEALAQRLDMRYGEPVCSLICEGGRVVGLELESGSSRRARHVVVAVTPDAAANLVPDELNSRKQFLALFLHVPLPLPFSFLGRPLDARAWTYFSDPAEERTFGMAVDQSARVPEMVPSGRTIVSAWNAYPQAAALHEQPDDVVIERAIDDPGFVIPGFGQWVEEGTRVRHS